MTRAAEYRRYATELRETAQHLGPGDRRDQLLKIARAWDELAGEGERRRPAFESARGESAT